MGTTEMWSQDFEIRDDSFAVPVMKKQITLDQKSGKYALIAYMKGASPLGNRLDFYVTDRNEIIANADVRVCGVAESVCQFLEQKGVGTKPFNGETEGLILAGNVDSEDIIALRKAAERGARVFFMDSSAFFGEKRENIKLLELKEDINPKENWEWLYHKESVLAKPGLFKGLGFGLVDQNRFGQVITNRCFETQITPDDVICPAFYTGYHGYETAYCCAQNAMGIKIGKGSIYLSAFDIVNNLGKEPAAELLLVNFMNYLGHELSWAVKCSG